MSAMELQSLSTPGLVYAIGNAYKVNFLRINNPTPFGFANVRDACCGTGTSPCTPSSRLCGNREVRNRYLFWSRLILTEYAARSTAQFFYGAVAGEFVYPITFGQLAES
ncbi:GDSL esterase/lipase LTL1 [Linum grandiflorum]